MFYSVKQHRLKKNVKKSTNKQTVVSVQLTGKWIERISQSERAPRKGYVIKISNSKYRFAKFAIND